MWFNYIVYGRESTCFERHSLNVVPNRWNGSHGSEFEIGREVVGTKLFHILRHFMSTSYNDKCG